VEKGGLLIVLANEWLMVWSTHDGVKRSPGRGWVSSKYSLGSGEGEGEGEGSGDGERGGEDGLKK
jgi:hypothetical protein